MAQSNVYKKENNSMKVAIVGAGISGLFVGWKLAERGEGVTIFEKDTEIGTKCYTHLYSNRLLDFVEAPKDIILNEILHCKIHFPKKTVTVNFSRPLLQIDYEKLNQHLAGLTEKSGARILLNNELQSIPPDFDRVIGSDGAESKIRELLGLKELKKYFAFQTIVEREDDSPSCEVWPVKGGFLWKIPSGQKGIELGLVTDLSKEEAEDLFKRFCEKYGSSCLPVKDGIIPIGLRSLPKDKKITLCGDSTGVVKPWSAGGVIWQLHQAEMLLKEWPDLERYRKAVYRFFRPTIAYSKFSNQLVRFSGLCLPFLLPQNRSIDPDFLFFNKQ